MQLSLDQLIGAFDFNLIFDTPSLDKAALFEDLKTDVYDLVNLGEITQETADQALNEVIDNYECLV